MARIVSGEFENESSGPYRWLKDGSAYLGLEESKEGKGRDIVRHDPLTGKSEVLVPAGKLVPQAAKEPLAIDSFAVSKDGRKLLLFTNTRKVWRLNSRGDYWVFDRDAGSLRKLGGKAAEASLMYAAFDPQGRRVAYVRENNLYVEEIAAGTIVPLTADGSPTIINGTFDWVYEEELALHDGFRWSPDGQSIAYWQLDSSGVSEYPMLNTAAGLYPGVVPVRYPKSGQRNPAARVGVVAASGGATRWFEFAGDPRENYITRMDWVPETRELLIQRLNRAQNTLQVNVADSHTGAVRTFSTDRDEAWVDVHDDLHWFDHWRTFTWTADRAGWRTSGDHAVARVSHRYGSPPATWT